MRDDERPTFLTRRQILASSVAIAGTIPFLTNERVAAAPESRAGQGFGPAYDLAHETTLAGTIQGVVTRPEAGSPAGMHLLIA